MLSIGHVKRQQISCSFRGQNRARRETNRTTMRTVNTINCVMLNSFIQHANCYRCAHFRAAAAAAVTVTTVSVREDGEHFYGWLYLCGNLRYFKNFKGNGSTWSCRSVLSCDFRKRNRESGMRIIIKATTAAICHKICKNGKCSLSVAIDATSISQYIGRLVWSV